MTLRQITLDEVDDPCLQCKKLGDDDYIPEACPLLIRMIPDRCYLAERVLGEGAE